MRVRPGTIAGRVNLALAPYGRKLGPDPASISACTMGGVIANNSSGMCCGIEQNTYSTLALADLRAAVGDRRRHRRARRRRRRFAAGRAGAGRRPARAARARCTPTPSCSSAIRTKYRRKNTTGYSLNAFVDFDEPLDVFDPPARRLRGHARVRRRGGARHRARCCRTRRPGCWSSRACTPPAPPSCRCATPAPPPSSCSTGRRCGPSSACRACRPTCRDLPDGAAALLVDLATADPDALPGARAGAQALARAASSSSRRASSPATPPCRRSTGRVRSGLFTSVGAARPTRHVGAARGRDVPGRAPRRRRRRPRRAVRAARLRRGGRLRPRQGRQPALPADAVAQRAGGGRALRALHGRPRRARRRPLRRRAQGRARHRAQHRAVRRAGVGRRTPTR